MDETKSEKKPQIMEDFRLLNANNSTREEKYKVLSIRQFILLFALV